MHADSLPRITMARATHYFRHERSFRSFCYRQIACAVRPSLPGAAGCSWSAPWRASSRMRWPGVAGDRLSVTSNGIELDSARIWCEMTGPPFAARTRSFRPLLIWVGRGGCLRHCVRGAAGLPGFYRMSIVILLGGRARGGVRGHRKCL
jgi:hypothetical protein